MLNVRVCVSFAQTGDPRGRAMAHRLITDLQARQAEVVKVPEYLSDRDLSAFLLHELPSCQYFILVQTPAALQSRHVRMTLQAARAWIDPSCLLRFQVISSGSEVLPSQWEALQVFDASEDYPRMRERLLVELGLILFNGPTDELSFHAPPVAGQFKAPLAFPTPATAPDAQPPAGSDWLETPQQYLDDADPVSLTPLPTAFTGEDKSFSVDDQAKPMVDQEIDRPGLVLLRRSTLWQGGLIVVLLLAILLVLTSNVWTSRYFASPPPTRAPGFTGVVSNPTPFVPTIVALDTFQRPDQQGWGLASDGHAWGADATNTAHFAIQQNRGEMTEGRTSLNATLGPSVADAEILFIGSLSLFKKASFGVLLRWVDATTFYDAVLDGQHLLVLKHVAGQTTLLGSVPFSATGALFYALRVRVQGTTLSARAWFVTDPEPAQWMVTVRDTTLQHGLGGVRVNAAPGITLTTFFFQERQMSPGEHV